MKHGLCIYQVYVSYQVNIHSVGITIVVFDARGLPLLHRVPRDSNLTQPRPNASKLNESLTRYLNPSRIQTPDYQKKISGKICNNDYQQCMRTINHSVLAALRPQNVVKPFQAFQVVQGYHGRRGHSNKFRATGYGVLVWSAEDI